MALPVSEDHIVDDEIFFGELSLEEVKKHISLMDDSGGSLEIIETHSAPNLNKTDINVPPKRAISNASLSSTESVLFSGWVKKPNDDTIMMVEQMVTEISEPRSTIKKSPELDNSLEIIDHILNHGPTDTVRSKNKPLEVKKTGNSPGNFELDPVIVIPDSNSLASKECNYLKCNKDPKHIPQLLKLTKCCYNDNSGDSLEIIETHSAPNLNKTDINVPPKRTISNASLSSTESVLFSGWVKKPNDDTIMIVEQMVTEISEPHSTIKKSPELDNSLEIIDHILNHGPTDTVRSKNKPLEVKKTGNSPGNFELDPVIVIPDSNSLASKECNYLKCNKDPKHIPQLLKLTKCCYNDNSGDSVEIIETHLAPKLNKRKMHVFPKKWSSSNASLSSTGSELFSGWDINPNDDTFLRLEKMVTEISELPNTSKKSHELDNTLDIIDYILNHGPTDTVHSGNKPSEVQRAGISLEEVKKHISLMDDSGGSLEIIETHSAPNLNKRDITVSPKRTISNARLSPSTKNKSTELDNTLEIIDDILNQEPTNNMRSGKKSSEVKNTHCISSDNFKLDPVTVIPDSLASKECKKLNKDIAKYSTPEKCELKYQRANSRSPRTPVFKTPRNPLSLKKHSSTSLKKTPKKNAAYQHVASPIASYIKNSPVTPLVKDVRPKKPLPGTSAIPKLIKKPIQPNKENVNLPAVAYRSAKMTKMIEVPDDKKLPKSHQVKKMTSALPKPVIVKHEHREVNLAKRILGSRQEDSFADLSLRQADVSVCTQKSAFNKPKKPV